MTFATFSLRDIFCVFVVLSETILNHVFLLPVNQCCRANKIFCKLIAHLQQNYKNQNFQCRKKRFRKIKLVVLDLISLYLMIISVLSLFAATFPPKLFSKLLKETRNSLKKWPLNLWWISNKTIMEVRNITKTATFKSFLHLSY